MDFPQRLQVTSSFSRTIRARSRLTLSRSAAAEFLTDFLHDSQYFGGPPRAEY